MIANRFVAIETTRAGIKARDQDTAQTVLLVDVSHFDNRLVGDISSRRSSRSLRSSSTRGAFAGRHGVRPGPFAQRVVSAASLAIRKRAAEIVSELADGVAELHAARHRARQYHRSQSALLTAKGKARLSLTSATGGDEMLDVNALKLVLKTHRRPADRCREPGPIGRRPGGRTPIVERTSHVRGTFVERSSSYFFGREGLISTRLGKLRAG